MHKRKRLDEEPFSHLRELRKERERERRRLRLIKGLEQGIKTVNPNLYHLYRDQTFFRYNVVLTRDDEESGIQGERYILMIHESNAKPHLYWFVAKYYRRKGDTQAKVYRPSRSPGVFAREFAQFERFFLLKTGVPWAQRLIQFAAAGAGAAGKNTKDTKEGDDDRNGKTGRLFDYAPPRGGKPVGWVPPEFMPADDESVDGAAADETEEEVTAEDEEHEAAVRDQSLVGGAGAIMMDAE
ncbi:hypothetical protein VTK26DRAFT_5745 [Humicola hyalothermophila]